MRVVGWESLERTMAARVPLVMITWHGRMMAPVWHCRRRNIAAMISRHSDGEMVARLVQRLGYETVRGSSTRGGTEAALDMLDRVRNGQVAAMICDGPRGPIYKMKPGAPYLALRAGAFVIPATFAAARAWTFKSWDRFLVPKPFSKVFLFYGDPIPPVDPSTDLEEFRLTLEKALNDLTARAERMTEENAETLKN
ncbi:DUF374 domain-containing protein [candidate division KSB1 bacterium]|nr:MAG: DUF374 domain-containing protein [candidate division KSB1 bacterium]